jgi:short-subunit dehydrogenase
MAPGRACAARRRVHVVTMGKQRTEERLGRQLAGAGAAVVLGLAGRWWLRRRKRRASLAGEVAIVTGSSRGLGALVARELARKGCRVVLCARNQEELERARGQLAATGAEVLAVPCDVTEPADVARLVSATLARFGRIDLLVNNAGIIQVGAAETFQLSDFEQALAVIFWGTVRTTLAVLPHMRARRHGRVVNVTSIGGKVAVPHLLPYACAKFAAVGFSEGLRAELAKDGISVTTIVPGLMRTGSDRFASFKGDVKGERRWFRVAARLPGLSMNARRAARQIVAAASRRQAERVLGLPARLLRLAMALFPGLGSRALGATNRLLPDPAGR